MRHLILAIVIAVVTLFTCVVAYAQQPMQAKKFDNPQWKRVEFVKFKSGKYPRAKEIIRDYFVKADQKSGTPDPSLFVDLITGEWDMMVVWDMTEGINEMNWETSPDDVKWMTSMNDITGGPNKAKAILDEFSSLIDKETRYIGKSASLIR
jgi:hypothetical protein